MLAWLFGLCVGALIGLAVGVRFRVGERGPSGSSLPAPPVTGPAPPSSIPTAAELEAPQPRSQLLARIDVALDHVFEVSGHPQDILDHELFAAARRVLASESFSTEELGRWSATATTIGRCAAFGPYLDRTGDAGEDLLIGAASTFLGWIPYVALAELGRRHPPTEPWIHALLLRLDETWTRPAQLYALQCWIMVRRDAGETVPEAETRRLYGTLPETRKRSLRILLQSLGPVAAPWADFLPPEPVLSDPRLVPTEPGEGSAAFTRRWAPAQRDKIPAPIMFPALEEAAARIVRILQDPQPRPVVIVGPPRTGKSALVREVMRRLLAEQWQILEASPDRVNAGAKFLGQLEDRVLRLAEEIRPGRRRLWLAPDVHALGTAGALTDDPGRGIGRVLQPDLEARRIVMLGECTLAAWDRLRAEQPALASKFEVIRAPVPDPEQTVGLVETWLRGHARDGRPLMSSALCREAWELTRQFFDENERPGNLFDVVLRTLEDRDRDAGASASEPVTRDDVLRSLSWRTGLPLAMLDTRAPLPLDDVHRFFAERIRGQDEAVRALVDRLAMIKTGLTDPSRPLGVFLFAGPTGTGKTELAKTLAAWLFGSRSRLVRLDMSELKDRYALDKLLGDPRPGNESLIDRIRREPFSVVLLDEFEKAHPEIWDLFLQVFDEGRLSDRQGRVVDFRHSMILMTTNLGSRTATRTRLGFTRDSGFEAESVMSALRATLRPELINRLDRVIVFNPLSRAVMREILERQVRATLRRRGLRDRPWLVEWEEPALELLLERGFSEHLGARPLQRAIDEYVLAPLARVIATHRAPDGDQFLFARRAGDALVLDFVDPDAPEMTPTPVTAAAAPQSPASLALDGIGTAAEMAALEEALRRLENVVAGEEWQERQRHVLAVMSDPSFWKSDRRAALLDEYEWRDRVAKAIVAARSLRDRLAGAERDRVPGKPLRQLALRIHVLGAAVDDLRAGRPRDVLLALEWRPGIPGEDGRGLSFHGRLVDMYRAWAQGRGFALHEIDGPPPGRGRWAAAVEGLGVPGLLAAEAGLHVLERRSDETHRPERHVIRVDVIPLTLEQSSPASWRALLAETAAASDAAARPVARRYREEPSPLVRGAGWRTGRLDRVLAGDFDLFAAS